MPDDTIFTSWITGLDFDYWSTGQHKITPTAFLEKWAANEAVLLDVRTEIEADHVHLPIALHIPINQLPKRLNEIPRDKLVATFCSGGDRANVAFAFLHAQGFENVRVLKGGYAELMTALLPGKLRKYRQAGK